MIPIFYNCGCYNHQRRIQTKKALKEALRENTSSVYFDGTSMHDTVPGYRGNEIPEGVTLSVVGPDPFTKRTWYALVKRNGDGLKVS